MTVDKNFVAGLLAKLGVGSEDAKKAVAILSDSEVSKSTHGQTLAPGEHVPDHWMQGQMHKVPTADTLKVGPTQESSGGGAEKMTSEYSHPAPQMGIQVEAERLAAELGSMRGYMKSQFGILTDAHNGLVDIVTKSGTQVQNLTTVMAAVLAKAEDEEKKKERDKEEEMHGDKACALFAKAKKLLKKSKSILAEAKAATDPAQVEALQNSAKLMRKAAVQHIVRAKVEALAGRGTAVDYTFETRKAIDAFISKRLTKKADLKLLHEGDDKDKDEEKKAKKAYKKAKAPVEAAKAVEGHSDAKGNQSDKQDGETKNQDDSSVKALAEMATKVDNALNGLGLLKTDVKGLIDAVSGRPVTQPLEPVAPLIKSVGDNAIEAIAQRIDAADENGAETPIVMKAKSLLQTMIGVKQGAVHQGIFDQQLSTSPAAVREIFSVAA